MPLACPWPVPAPPGQGPVSHASATGHRPLPTGSMSPEEFNRIKEEEKEHLRTLRALKKQHADAQRTAASLGALQTMQDGLRLADETGTRADDLMRGAATQEARLDLALESAEAAARAEADRESLRKAEADALVAQMKAGLGATGSASPAAGTSAPSSAAPKTIGRAPVPEPEPSAPPRDAKTLGRPR